MVTTNNFSKGLQTDVMPKHQPEGTYRMAMNAVLETEDGDISGISNELGNLSCAENYPEGKIPLGSALLDNEEIVLALYDSEGDHEIGIFNPSNCTYTTTYTDPCLNFDLCYPINILFRVRNGCERVIYFCDGPKNPYRVLNLTNPPVSGNCNLIKYNPDYSQMCPGIPIRSTDASIRNYGGNLEIGVYYYFFRYLDAEQNPTNWMFGTRGVPIADEPFSFTNASSTYSMYEGGSNILESPYYVPRTSKSVTFEISNLDYLNYRYYQAAVVKRTGDSGEILGVDVLNPVEMDDGLAVFIHTGFDSQVLYTTSIDEILSEKLPVDTVVAHAQLNNRLFVAAPQTTKYNYSSYQRYASKIKVEWVKQNSSSVVDAYNKQPRYYNKDGSFMEDEVIPFGIVFVHEDGTYGPVNTIPGRAPDVVTGSNPAIGTLGVATDTLAWDTGLVLTAHGNQYNPAKALRWQQISTATQYPSGSTAGLMGYHEAETATYPDIQTCDEHEDGYWGRDWQGNLIDSSVKIRHHRMPDTNLLSGFAPDIVRIGVRFSNIEYPEGVVGHFFVFSDEEPTILSKGVIIPLCPTFEEPWNHRKDSEDAYVFDPRRLRPQIITDGPDDDPILPPGDPILTKVFAFLSPENILKKVEYNPLWFRAEKIMVEQELEFTPDHSNNSSLNNIITVQVPNLINGSLEERDLEVDSYIYDFTNYERPDFEHLNYNLRFCGRIDATTPDANQANAISAIDGPIIVYNKSTHLSPHILQFQDDMFEYSEAGETFADRFYYGSLKVDLDPYTALHNIRYKRMSNCVLVAASPAVVQTSYEGNVFTSRVAVMDYTYRQGFDGDPDTEEKDIKGYFMQFPAHSSKVNYEFVHGGIKPEHNRFHWNLDYTQGLKLFAEHLSNKYYETITDVMAMHPIPYQYMDSYTYMQALRDYYPLPLFYDYCNDCLENSPYRIYYSELDNNEDSADAYRIIKPNNFRDLDGSTGPITDLFTNFGELFAATPNTIWNVPVQPQQMVTEESSIYIGTSEVLGVPPRQLKTSDNAFGGYNFFKSRVSTEYGTAYVDDTSGRAFIVSDQLQDISLKGLRNTWQNTGKVGFLKQFFDLTGHRFTCKSTSSPFGVGYISAYDPRYKRIIFHKKDFKLLPQWTNVLVYVDEEDDVKSNTTPGVLFYNNYKFYYNHTALDQEEIPFSNTLFFENKSFTISYSFLSDSWVSYHSYLPIYMFGGQLDFYSVDFQDYTNTTVSLYEHNHGPFTTYYDTKYPFMIDMIVTNSPLEAKTTTAILYAAKASGYDVGTNTYVPTDITFDGLIAYNENQTTGKLKLIPKKAFDMDFATDSAFVTRVDNQYRINNLRDIANSNYDAIWSSSWNATEPNYFIDRVPNPSNLDYNKSPFESKRLRDFYTGLRLFFEHPDNIKITTDVVATTFANRNR